MAVQTTSNLSNSLAAVNKSSYLMGIMSTRLYDMLAVPYTEIGADGKSMDELMRSSSITIPYLSAMTPGVTAISQTSDVTPQVLVDATASVTTTSRGEALQWSKQLLIQAYTDYAASAYKRVGENAGESIDLLAQAAACQGTWVDRYVARASLDAGTSTHRASDAIFRKYQGVMRTLRIPGFATEDGEMVWSAIMHDFPFHDICESGNVDSIGLYQDRGIHLNFELGQIGPFRLVTSPFAKVFGGAGLDNGTAVATTLATAASPLDTTFVTAGDVSANVAVGLFWTIGTEETGNTFYPTNEMVKPLSASTVTITALGQAENGGLRYEHAVGAAVRNADSVYSVVFGGPQSLVKVYATDVGPFGEVIGPKLSGYLDQFTSLGWRYYGGYSRLGTNRILRFECSTSYEA